MNAHIGFEKGVTLGDYEIETDAESAFDAMILKTKIFKMWQQCDGFYEYVPYGKERSKARIDRILCPIGGGNIIFPFGFIGVEIKKSNIKKGKAISQCLDYRSAIFCLKGRVPAKVRLDYVFLFPAKNKGGDPASIAAQNQLGTVHVDNQGNIVFASGQHKVITIKKNGSMDLGKPVGKKMGSR